MFLRRRALALALVGTVCSARAQELSMSVDASKTGEPIHPRDDRQTITLSSLSDEYARFPLNFTSDV